MSLQEPTNIGVPPSTHAKLKHLKDEGFFHEMADAYRFAIGLAMASGVNPSPTASTQTTFGVASIDPDQVLKTAISAIYAEAAASTPVYKIAESLADWGIQELYALTENGDIDFEAIFEEVDAIQKGSK